MKNIWLLTKTNVRRNTLAIFLSIFGAAILCLILNAMGSLVVDLTLSKISIGVIDEDQSILSEDFKGYLKDQLNYEIEENYTYDRLSTELIDKNISVIIEIPEDFYEQFATGNKQSVTITSLEDYENAAFIQVYINNYFSSINILSDSAGGNLETFDQLLTDYKKEHILLKQTAAQEIDKKLLSAREGFINSIGFYLMFIFSISIMLSFMILDDRMSGVYSRIQVTPVKPIQYIIGSGIFGLILCLIQIGLYCGYIYFVDLQIGIPMWILVLLMSLFSLFTISFTIAISLAFKSKNAIASIIMGFSTIGCILGGAYFPLDTSPKTLQNLARVLPQYWFMDLLRKLQVDITANIYPNIIILVLFSTLFLLIGAVLFSQNYKNS
ncbi:MAG: ABC transporter permease [Mobilitalea sp.]